MWRVCFLKQDLQNLCSNTHLCSSSFDVNIYLYIDILSKGKDTFTSFPFDILLKGKACSKEKNVKNETNFERKRMLKGDECWVEYASFPFTILFVKRKRCILISFPRNMHTRNMHLFLLTKNVKRNRCILISFPFDILFFSIWCLVKSKTILKGKDTHWYLSHLISCSFPFDILLKGKEC